MPATPLESILNAFFELRRRGVRDPVYARLKARVASKAVVGFIWRDSERSNRPLETRETFIVSTLEEPSVTARVKWTVPFRIDFVDSIPEPSRKRLLWFLHQQLEVSGGSHESIDSYRGGAADWSRPASDFFLVRCGTYSIDEGERRFRRPSENAESFVRDPARFRVPAPIRAQVIAAMGKTLPNGESLTIRRLFPERAAEIPG